MPAMLADDEDDSLEKDKLNEVWRVSWTTLLRKTEELK